MNDPAEPASCASRLTAMTCWTRVVVVALALGSAAACSGDSCFSGGDPASKMLADGGTIGIDLKVDEYQMLDTLDVNGGYYEAPSVANGTRAGPIVDLRPGTYRGTVRRNGDAVMLQVEGQGIRLEGPLSCDFVE